MPSQPDETWRSEFQTAAKDLAAPRARPFAALRACPQRSEGVTRMISKCLRSTTHSCEEYCSVIDCCHEKEMFQHF